MPNKKLQRKKLQRKLVKEQKQKQINIAEIKRSLQLADPENYELFPFLTPLNKQQQKENPLDILAINNQHALSVQPGIKF